MERTDAELVVAATSGDHDAFASLYDRYGARIYGLCAHMLRNRDEAADATADVFLRAHEHLGQLREPEKCKSWLYAIARNEVYRRTQRRAKESVTDMTDDLVPPTIENDDVTDPDALAGLVREAALGLDDRDRLVLEFVLAGGLEGRELGDALGVSENGAHQAAHRMRDRLGRSVGALLVARQGRAECEELAALLATWDGTFSVLWRKRVARHVDGCEVCERRRKAIPATIFSGTAFAALPISHLEPPPWVRERVVQGGPPAGSEHWQRDGFPRRPGPPRTAAVLVALAAALAIVVLVAAVAGGSSSDSGRVVASPGSTTENATTTNSSIASSSSTTAGAPSTTTANSGITVAPTTPATNPNASTTTTLAPTTTTTAPDTSGPVLEVFVPEALGETDCPSNPPLTATATDPSGVAGVALTYTRVNPPGTPSVPQAYTRGSGNAWTLDTTAPYTDGVTIDFYADITARDTLGYTTSVRRTVTVSGCIT